MQVSQGQVNPAPIFRTPSNNEPAARPIQAETTVREIGEQTFIDLQTTHSNFPSINAPKPPSPKLKSPKRKGCLPQWLRTLALVVSSIAIGSLATIYGPVAINEINSGSSSTDMAVTNYTSSSTGSYFGSDSTSISSLSSLTATGFNLTDSTLTNTGESPSISVTATASSLTATGSSSILTDISSSTSVDSTSSSTTSLTATGIANNTTTIKLPQSISADLYYQIGDKAGKLAGSITIAKTNLNNRLRPLLYYTPCYPETVDYERYIRFWSVPSECPEIEQPLDNPTDFVRPSDGWLFRATACKDLNINSGNLFTRNTLWPENDFDISIFDGKIVTVDRDPIIDLAPVNPFPALCGKFKLDRKSA